VGVVETCQERVARRGVAVAQGVSQAVAHRCRRPRLGALRDPDHQGLQDFGMSESFLHGWEADRRMQTDR